MILKCISNLKLSLKISAAR